MFSLSLSLSLSHTHTHTMHTERESGCWMKSFDDSSSKHKAVGVVLLGAKSCNVFMSRARGSGLVTVCVCVCVRVCVCMCQAREIERRMEER